MRCLKLSPAAMSLRSRKDVAPHSSMLLAICSATLMSSPACDTKTRYGLFDVPLAIRLHPVADHARLPWSASPMNVLRSAEYRAAILFARVEFTGRPAATPGLAIARSAAGANAIYRRHVWIGLRLHSACVQLAAVGA